MASEPVSSTWVKDVLLISEWPRWTEVLIALGFAVFAAPMLAAAGADVAAMLAAAVQDNKLSSAADHQTFGDTELTMRRRELLTQLDEQNQKLESAAAQHKQRLVALGQQIQAKWRQKHADITEHSLKHPSVANPDLLNQLFAAEQASKYAGLRLNAARDYADKLQEAIAAERRPGRQAMTQHNTDLNGKIIRQRGDSEACKEYLLRLKRYEVEILSAGKWLAEARAEADRILQAIIDE